MCYFAFASISHHVLRLGSCHITLDSFLFLTSLPHQLYHHAGVSLSLYQSAVEGTGCVIGRDVEGSACAGRHASER